MWLSTIIHHLETDRTGPGTTAPDGNFGRVSTERADVLLYSVQGRTLIQKSGIGGAVLLHFTTSSKAVRSKAVLNRDIDNRTIGFRDKLSTVHCESASTDVACIIR
jgi:hypothetical protein